MYTMSEVAAKVSLSQKRIREYEKEGFIRPARQDRTNNRLFSDYDVDIIKRLTLLIHKKGFTIASLKHLMKMAPCWKIFDCKEKNNCLIYKNSSPLCWEILKGKENKCGTTCENCLIYRNADIEDINLFEKNNTSAVKP
jgi:MerR family transcriptional regulator, repressor of the yfmOP operon